MAHRLQPLPASMKAHRQKRHRSDEFEQQDHAQNYALMLHNLMVTIQDYLLLSDNDRERGALQGAHSDRARHPRGHASHPKRGTETEAK